MASHFLLRWKLAIETILFVIFVMLAKYLVETNGLEFIQLNSLFTSIIGGGIFLFGLILAGTLADYKESEKIPSEIASACENILEEGVYVKDIYDDFDLTHLRTCLAEILTTFLSDLSNGRSRDCMEAISGLSKSFREMELLGIPANYIVRLKTEQAAIRRNVLRTYYIQKINFLPSAFVLLETIVILIITLLIFTKIEPFITSIILIGFVAYLFVYVFRLLKILDNPFRVGERTMDDISLFLLKETWNKLQNID
ncbi:MAG: hypothetical protein ACYC27_10190 [Armatimonadota bacterium]